MRDSDVQTPSFSRQHHGFGKRLAHGMPPHPLFVSFLLLSSPLLSPEGRDDDAHQRRVDDDYEDGRHEQHYYQRDHPNQAESGAARQFRHSVDRV